MSFRETTDEMMMDMVRLLFWVFIVFANIQFWTGFNIFEWVRSFRG